MTGACAAAPATYMCAGRGLGGGWEARGNNLEGGVGGMCRTGPLEVWTERGMTHGAGGGSYDSLRISPRWAIGHSSKYSVIAPAS